MPQRDAAQRGLCSPRRNLRCGGNTFSTGTNYSYIRNITDYKVFFGPAHGNSQEYTVEESGWCFEPDEFENIFRHTNTGTVGVKQPQKRMKRLP